MAASLPTLNKPMGKKMDPDKIGFQPVKQLYMSVIDGVMDSVEEVFLDEGIDKEIWYELLHVWQSKLVDWNVLDQVVERPRPEQNRNGLPIPPPRPLPPFCPANEQEKTPLYIETSVPGCDSLTVLINVPFASIHDGKLQQALALPEMMDILKDKNRIHTLESKVLEAIENLNAAAALNDTTNGTNTGNEPSTSAQHEPMDLSLSVAGPGPMSLSRQGKALEAKTSLPQRVKFNPNSLMVKKLAAEMVSTDTATPNPAPKKRQRKAKELGAGESNAIAPRNNTQSKKLPKIELEFKPKPVQGVSGNGGKKRPSKLPSLAVTAHGKVNRRGRTSNPLVIKREEPTLSNKNECSTPSDHSSLNGTQPVKLKLSGKKSNPAVTVSPNKRGRGRLSKTPKMTDTGVKVNRGGKQIMNPEEERNQVEQLGRGLLLKQENISQAVQVIHSVWSNAAVMKMDGITPPKKRGRPPKISCNPIIVDSGVRSQQVDRKEPIVIAKPDLPDQTEAETTTSNRRERPSKVATSPSLEPPPEVVKPLTPKRRGRPSKFVSSPSPKRMVPPKVEKSATPKRRGRPSKVVNSAAHLDGATGGDDSDSDDDDQDVSGFGFSSSSSHNLTNMAKIVKNVLGTSIRNTECKANMEEQDDNDSEMEGQDPKSKVDEASDSDWGDYETDDDDDDIESTRREPWYSEDAVVLPKASMYCQYEKITRTRNKWKFFLKDGIMHLDGKDYVFQKAHGDAMW